MRALGRIRLETRVSRLVFGIARGLRATNLRLGDTLIT
jgi:hypothetical protein